MARRKSVYEPKASDFLATHLRQAVKSHLFWSSGQMIVQFTADADAEHGDTCLRTDYQFDGSSNRTTGTLESLATWDSAWDFAPWEI